MTYRPTARQALVGEDWRLEIEHTRGTGRTADKEESWERVRESKLGRGAVKAHGVIERVLLEKTGKSLELTQTVSHTCTETRKWQPTHRSLQTPSFFYFTLIFLHLSSRSFCLFLLCAVWGLPLSIKLHLSPTCFIITFLIKHT